MMGARIQLSEKYRPFLEDLKTFDCDRTVDAEECFTAQVVQEAIHYGYVDTMFTGSFGEVVYLSLRGRRAMGFGSIYKPSERAAKNQIAARYGIKILKEQGYKFLGEQQKHLWKLKKGKQIVFASIPFDGSSARVISRMLDNLEDQEATVLVFHPHPKQIKHLAVKYPRLEIIQTPWATN
jgi:hypothetical protein